jgi:hypothetical protein
MDRIYFTRVGKIKDYVGLFGADQTVHREDLPSSDHVGNDANIFEVFRVVDSHLPRSYAPPKTFDLLFVIEILWGMEKVYICM